MTGRERLQYLAGVWAKWIGPWDDRDRYHELGKATFEALAHGDELVTLRSRLAAVEAERDAARAGEARAVEALEKIFIGGNHLASALTHMLGDDFLEYETDFNQACEILNDPIKYDLWVCWAVIMRVRDSLSDPQPALDWLAQQRRETAAEENDRLAGEWWAFNDEYIASELSARAAALRAGEVGNE